MSTGVAARHMRSEAERIGLERSLEALEDVAPGNGPFTIG
jgi:hypothetical protein